jgi:hypothetical protein
VYDLETTRPPIELRPPEITRIVERRDNALWSGFDVIFLAALLFGAEWWLRRKFGYL